MKISWHQHSDPVPMNIAVFPLHLYTFVYHQSQCILVHVPGELGKYANPSVWHTRHWLLPPDGPRPGSISLCSLQVSGQLEVQ